MHISQTIPSRLELIPDLISSMMEKLYHLPLDEYTVFNIKLAIQEAVINAVEHGNKLNPELSVVVDISADARNLAIQVTDQGEGFDYKSIPDPTDPGNIEKLRGRGIFLIQYVMDKMEFSNKGRTIKMTKRLEKPRKTKMQTQVERVNGVAVLVLSGEISSGNVLNLREAFIKVTGEGLNRVLVDFAKVEFVDSSGLAALIEAFKHLKEKHGKLILCSVNKRVRGIFEITKVHQLIEIYADRESALKALK